MVDERPKEVVVERERRSGVGTVVAVVVGIIVLVLLAMYVLPYLTGNASNPTTDINVQAPVPTNTPTE